jgi:hypothetical protein
MVYDKLPFTHRLYPRGLELSMPILDMAMYWLSTGLMEDMVEPAFEVNLADHPIVAEFFKQFFFVGHGVSRCNGLVVEGVVVDAHAEFNSFLRWNKTGAPQGLREGRIQPWLVRAVS